MGRESPTGKGQKACEMSCTQSGETVRAFITFGFRSARRAGEALLRKPKGIPMTCYEAFLDQSSGELVDPSIVSLFEREIVARFKASPQRLVAWRRYLDDHIVSVILRTEVGISTDYSVSKFCDMAVGGARKAMSLPYKAPVVLSTKINGKFDDTEVAAVAIPVGSANSALTLLLETKRELALQRGVTLDVAFNVSFGSDWPGLNAVGDVNRLRRRLLRAA